MSTNCLCNLHRDVLARSMVLVCIDMLKTPRSQLCWEVNTFQLLKKKDEKYILKKKNTSRERDDIILIKEKLWGKDHFKPLFIMCTDIFILSWQCPQRSSIHQCSTRHVMLACLSVSLCSEKIKSTVYIHPLIPFISTSVFSQSMLSFRESFLFLLFTLS